MLQAPFGSDYSAISWIRKNLGIICFINLYFLYTVPARTREADWMMKIFAFAFANPVTFQREAGECS